VDAWRADVLEAAGYPNDKVDLDTLTDVGRSADDFLLDMDKTEVGWIVNNDQSLEEMAHVQLFSVEEEP
jgi:hypothetical protein